MRADRLGEAFAAGQPGADELVGVAAVRLGTRRADRGSAVPARGAEHLVRQRLGIQRAHDLAGSGVQVADGAVQADRADTPPGGGGPGEPGVVVVAGGAVEQLSIEGPGVRSGPRARVDEHEGQGQRRDTHPARRSASLIARGSGGVGSARQEFSICFTTKLVGGTVRTSSESSAVHFVSPSSIPDYKIHPSIRMRINHYLDPSTNVVRLISADSDTVYPRERSLTAACKICPPQLDSTCDLMIRTITLLDLFHSSQVRQGLAIRPDRQIAEYERVVGN